jgi:hypothetical protein
MAVLMRRDIFSLPKAWAWLMLGWKIKKKYFYVHNVNVVGECASADLVAAES